MRISRNITAIIVLEGQRRGPRKKRFAITGRPNYPIELLPGQKMFLNRGPLNKSDANAIAVLNTSSKVVGHLTR